MQTAGWKLETGQQLSFFVFEKSARRSSALAPCVATSSTIAQALFYLPHPCGRASMQSCAPCAHVISASLHVTLTLLIGQEEYS